MRRGIQKLKRIGWSLTVWRTTRPDDAALAFDLSVIAIGLLFIGVSTPLGYFADDEPTVTNHTSSVAPNLHQPTEPIASDVSTHAGDPAGANKRVFPMRLSRPASPSVAAGSSWRDDRESNRALPKTYAASRRHFTVPSPAAFFEAQRRLVGGQTQRATEVFSSLAVTYPNDPGAAYHLAVTLYVAGRKEEATTAAVRAATLERRHGLPGYGWLMERIQGPHRVWLEGIRRPIVRR
jgi:hypothetical protein